MIRIRLMYNQMSTQKRWRVFLFVPPEVAFHGLYLEVLAVAKIPGLLAEPGSRIWILYHSIAALGKQTL